MASARQKVTACLTKIYGDHPNKKFRLTCTKVTIGRSWKAGIRLINPNVSRNHCTLIYTNSEWRITDDNSQNGTYISGRKIKPGEFSRLDCGDIIFLGPPSEMPEAFCFDDSFADDEDINPPDEYENIVIEVPSIKRPAEQEAMVISKKKNLENIYSNVMMDVESGRAVPSSSNGYTNEPSGSMTYEESLGLDTKEMLKKLTVKSMLGHTGAVREEVSVKNVSLSEPRLKITVDCYQNMPVGATYEHNSSFENSLINTNSCKLKQSDSGYQINEISSTGEDQKEDDSLSLIQVKDSDALDLPPSEAKNKTPCYISKASKETEVLKSRLALLTEQFKTLEKSKSDLLKNYENACKENDSLNQQLAEQKDLEETCKKYKLKAKDEVKHELLEKFEEDLICNICTELLIKPTVLDCSHTFCQFCIKIWKKKKNECPICRKNIQTMTPVLTLEHFIDKTLSTLTPEQRDRRNQLIKEREAPPKKTSATPKRKNSRRGRFSNRYMYRRSRIISSTTSPPGDIEIIAERNNMLPLPIPNNVLTRPSVAPPFSSLYHQSPLPIYRQVLLENDGDSFSIYLS